MRCAILYRHDWSTSLVGGEQCLKVPEIEPGADITHLSPACFPHGGVEPVRAGHHDHIGGNTLSL